MTNGQIHFVEGLSHRSDNPKNDTTGTRRLRYVPEKLLRYGLDDLVVVARCEVVVCK